MVTTNSKLEEIEKLQNQIKEEEEKFQQRRREILLKLSRKIQEAYGEEPSEHSQETTSQETTSQEYLGNGSSKTQVSAVKSESQPATRSTNQPAAKRQPPVVEQRKMGCRNAVLNVLERDPSDWQRILPDLPKDVEGLKVPEIREIIEIENLWHTDKDLGGQVSNHVSTLKKEGKLQRIDDRRYCMAE